MRVGKPGKHSNETAVALELEVVVVIELEMVEASGRRAQVAGGKVRVDERTRGCSREVQEVWSVRH